MAKSMTTKTTTTKPVTKTVAIEEPIVEEVVEKIEIKETIYLIDYPELLDTLYMLPSIEPRAASFFVKKEKEVVIVKPERQLLQMIEKVASHLRLHSYAYYMSVALNEIVKKHSYNVYT